MTNPDSEVTKHTYLDDGRLMKTTLRYGGTKPVTRELFYEDTDDSHAYIANENRYLRKTLDKDSTATTIASSSYELDAAGLRLSVTDVSSKYTAFQLDPLGQLKAETKWSAKTFGTKTFQYVYSLDANGNRLQQFKDGTLTESTFGDNNELLTSGSDKFTYDNFGNTASRASGATTSTFSWDFESHMTQATGVGSTDTHEYDGDGRRMASKLASATVYTNFVYDEAVDGYPCLICEYLLVSGTFAIESLNTWGIGLVSTNRGGTKRYFHTKPAIKRFRAIAG